MSEKAPENPSLDTTEAEDIEVVAHSDEEERPDICIINNSNPL